MSFNIGIGTRLLAPVALASLSALIANTATAQSIQGTATVDQTSPPKAAGARPLEGTYWKAVELGGKPTPTQDAKREAHLLFEAAGRLSGSDGCNRVTGSYQLKGDAVTFDDVAATTMACLNTAEVERAFRAALKSATRLTILGDRLELFDAAGNRVAAFTAGAQANPSGLAGTSWMVTSLSLMADGGIYEFEPVAKKV